MCGITRVARRFAEQHRRLLNAYVRHTPSLLDASLRLLLKAPRLIDFDNKRSHFRGRIRASHDDRYVEVLLVEVYHASTVATDT